MKLSPKTLEDIIDSELNLQAPLLDSSNQGIDDLHPKDFFIDFSKIRLEEVVGGMSQRELEFRAKVRNDFGQVGYVRDEQKAEEMIKKASRSYKKSTIRSEDANNFS